MEGVLLPHTFMLTVSRDELVTVQDAIDNAIQDYNDYEDDNPAKLERLTTLQERFDMAWLPLGDQHGSKTTTQMDGNNGDPDTGGDPPHP